ncbi:UNVERIFIED_CONTAM: hypothetical protein Sindi_0723000 [Sesamum indicum]
MDSQFSLSSLSHTSTPKKSDTCTSNTLISLPPAGEAEDAGDDESDIGEDDDDGQNEDNGGRRNENVGGDSPKNLLRDEDERSDSISPAFFADFPQTDGTPSIVEDRATDPLEKDEIFRRKEPTTRAPPLLGFEEDERSRSKTTMKDSCFLISEGCNNIVGTRGGLPMGKETNFAAALEKPKLEFRDGVNLMNDNGGHKISPADFNLEERKKKFLGLANRVLDGDEASFLALKDLKNRLEENFGRSVLQRPATMTAGMRKAWRCVLPAKGTGLDGKQTENTAAAAGSSSSPANLQIPAKNNSPPVNSSRITAAGNSDAIPARFRQQVDVNAADGEVSNDASADTGDDASADTGDDANADVIVDDAGCDISKDVEKNSPLATHLCPITTGLYIGNIPLQANSNAYVDDKIANTFNNSTLGWTLLLSGSLKIPRHLFILWLAILGKLPTTDKPWLSHFGDCILCNEGATETHSHLFFQCRFSRQCLIAIRRKVQFHWPNRDWVNDIEWASHRWRGKHIVNIAYRALLASSVYHIWRERNIRRFEQRERTPSTMALLIVDDVRQRIISISLASSVSTRALYRLWRIPWPVEGETTR